MANKFYNKQTAPTHEAPKSQDRKGKPATDKKPGFKQVIKEPIGFPTMKDQGFQSKKIADSVS